ncbi:MAG TPA: histidine phosphatase family protein [Candidatus Udaeobacter sp.]|nr:histidine phosphatase family protein [Candidatus Udaeobacter sp.]
MTAGAENLTRAMRSLEKLFLIGVEGVTEIWLVRHADVYDDLLHVEDPPLSARGRMQAAQLAERVRRAKPAAVYASPFQRAIETARFITDDLQVDERLIEMDLVIGEDGSFDLKEAPDAAAARMRAALGDMVAAHPGSRVIAVTHGAAIIACLSDLMQLEPGRLRLLPYYTSISTVRVLGDRHMVGTLGDVAHLE